MSAPNDGADLGASDTAEFERLLEHREVESYVLQLYVSGMSPRSTSAIRIIKALCDERLPGNYTLEIVDLYDDPHAAAAHQVIASPTLIRHKPLPVRRLIGDMSDFSSVLRTLDLA